MLPLVSIGIPTRNRRHMLTQAIRSVVGQTYEGEIEAVVIDDGSTDQTEQAVSGVPVPARRKVRYFRNEINRGIAFTKNRALLLGNGEVRGILDDDDFYHPNFVESCVRQLQYRKVEFVYADNFLVVHPNIRIIAQRWPALDWNLRTLLETRNLRGDSWLASWDLLKRTDLHDELFELEVDYDLFYQIAEITEPVRVPEFLHYVREHRDRTSSGRMSGAGRQGSAYWHAVGLAKYGHSIEHAHARARQFRQDWSGPIKTGFEYGQHLREMRELRRLRNAEAKYAVR